MVRMRARVVWRLDSGNFSLSGMSEEYWQRYTKLFQVIYEATVTSELWSGGEAVFWAEGKLVPRKWGVVEGMEPGNISQVSIQAMWKHCAAQLLAGIHWACKWTLPQGANLVSYQSKQGYLRLVPYLKGFLCIRPQCLHVRPQSWLAAFTVMHQNESVLERHQPLDSGWSFPSSVILRWGWPLGGSYSKPGALRLLKLL